MKREIREKAIEFRQREEDLLVASKANPDDASLKVEMMRFRKEKKDWLSQIGGLTDDMSLVEIAKLNSLVEAAEMGLTRAAKNSASVAEYISKAAENIRDYVPNYERNVDDKCQLAAIAEDSAIERVKALDKFNRKRNKQSFINVVICKFKRQKASENTQDSQQGPTQG